jgi:hypothetical protein
LVRFFVVLRRRVAAAANQKSWELGMGRAKAENNFRTLWRMTRGYRLRYLYALMAMFCGVGMLYPTPLITRAAIDGVIDAHSSANLSMAARFVAERRER